MCGKIFKRHTDLIEPLSLDEAYLDVTENKTGLPTATLVARTIRKQIRQELNLTASAGVAPNKFLAKLASDWRKPDGLFVIQPEDIDAFLLPLPVGRLPGVGKVTGEKLAKLGIKTVGDLRAFDLCVLEDHFGRYGRRLHELARGIDDTEVVPDRPTQSISVEDTFEQDVSVGRNRAHDPAPCRKALVCFAQRITHSPHRRPQTEDERVQDSHAQPDARLSSLVLRRVDQHRAEAARTSGLKPTATLSARRRRVEQLSGSRTNSCPAGSFRVRMYLGSCGRTRRLLPHHLQHPLFHLFCRRFSLMGANHPGITVRVYNGAAAITPKHIHYRTLACSAEFGRFVDDLVHFVHIDEEAGRRSA